MNPNEDYVFVGNPHKTWQWIPKALVKEMDKQKEQQRVS